MTSFTRSRLTLARKRKGSTKTALADATGLSEKSIRGYESGTQEPSLATRQLLAQELGFPASYFDRPPVDEVPLMGSSFRALSRVTAAKRDQARAAGSMAIELSQWIDDRFHLPRPDVPRYDVDPETAAEAVRNEWGLGERPLSNMIHVLEAHGVRVFSLVEETRDIDAFSVWVDGVPFVFLNTMKSAEHSRMDAAHELGHLVLHSAHEGPTGRAEEKDAQQFGAAFLMPRGSVIADAPRGGSLRDLIRAKRRWKVSLANLAYRMHQLELLTDWQYRSVFIEISSRGYRTSEPQGIARESSQLLAKVFESMRDEGTGYAQVADELDMPVDELKKLVFGLVLTDVEGEGIASGSDIARPLLTVVNSDSDDAG